MTRIRISEPAFVGNEVAYVTDCLARKQLSAGDYVRRFEALVAEQSGVRHGVAMMNGTAALHAALLALGCGPECEVIVPATTYIATANAVTYTGATPVFVDVRPDTWTIDWEAASRAVTERTVGVIPVHLYGVPATIAADLGDLWMLEDAAEAHGAVAQDGRPVGSLGEAAVYSYYGNKVLACGEGGMVVTDSTEMAARLRSIRGQGMSPLRRYVHTSLGYNYRMTELQGALGLAQAERLAEHVQTRRMLALAYRASLPSGATPLDWPDGSVDWVMPVRVRKRDVVAEMLTLAGIETRPVFPPLHQQPMYATGQRLPVAESAGAEGLLLPLHGNMTFEDVGTVCDALADALKGASVGLHA